MRHAHGSESVQNDADRVHAPADVWVSQHTTMSDSASGAKSPTDTTPSSIEIRRTIGRRVDLNDTPDVRTVIVDVAADLDIRQAAVARQLAAMDRNGFIYTVGEGVTAEVRTP